MQRPLLGRNRGRLFTDYPGVRVPPRHEVAGVVGLEGQATGDGLFTEPVGQLALGLGERLAEVTARGRRPPDGREVGPHPFEVVGHAPIQPDPRSAYWPPWSSRRSSAAGAWSATTATR